MSVTSRSTKYVSNGAHNPSVGFYEPTQQGTTHCYVSSSIVCQQNDEMNEDTSHRCVSSSYPPPHTLGCRITTSTTIVSAMDTLKCAHYLLPRLHESTDQCLTPLNVFPDVDHQEDPQDMCLRRVLPSLSLCPPTYGHCTSFTPASTVDMSKAKVQKLNGQCVKNALRRVPTYQHVCNPPVGSYEPPCQCSMCCGASLGVC